MNTQLKWLTLLPCLITSMVFAGPAGIAPVKDSTLISDVYVVSIGINKYPEPLTTLQNCVADARALTDKIEADNTQEQKTNTKFGKVHSALLLDEEATLANIRNALLEVSRKATSRDYFIFNFAGISTPEKGTLFPYTDKPYTGLDVYMSDSLLEALNFKDVLKLPELARLMEQIPCNQQLVISEAGQGKAFAQQLISELFESDPLVAAGTDRNRLIITTRGLGYDEAICRDSTFEHGPLSHFILQNGNILDVFRQPDVYEFELTRSEIECDPMRGRKYVAIYREKEFMDILLSNYKRSSEMRNSSTADTMPVAPDADPVTDLPITYCLAVATNEYRANTGWDPLKNPRNDAEVFGNILEDRYGVELRKVYNQPRDSILLEILAIKELMDENDRFILFVSGHGYYSDAFSDGYLVLKDSRPLAEDQMLNSYLQMASLHRILDNMPSPQVFVVIDVCFGAAFESGSRDLFPEDYKDVMMDIGLDELIERKNQYQSRVFLAAGAYTVPDYWSTSRRHSPFAQKLIYSLMEEEEFTSPGKLYMALSGNITEPVLKQFGKNDPRADFILKAREIKVEENNEEGMPSR